MQKIYWLIAFCTWIGLADTSAQLIHVKRQDDKTIVLDDGNGQKLKITAYGPSMIRFQFAAPGKDFLPHDYREMVYRHDQAEPLGLKETMAAVEISTEQARVLISRKNFSIRFSNDRQDAPLLISHGYPATVSDSLVYRFIHDPAEHFAGLGHDFTGRLESLDLRGKIHRRNYAHNPTRFTQWEYAQQAPLIVPFYLSSKGYGIFLNSTFTNYFNFGENGQYEFGIHTHGQYGEIDFFFIAGPGVKDVVEQYTDLTGKPRMPPMSVLGLQLTDKVHDHSHKSPSDENWWKQQVSKHRAAGLAIDHLVNDNRWRAQGGKRCESVFEWDKGRFPDPVSYGTWLRKNNLSITLDWNRCISAKSDGWKKEYNLKGEIPFHEFAESAPDFSSPATRKWIWDLFRSKAIDTALHYPVDGLWIDEVDEMYTIPYKHDMAGGKWGELANYWFMFIAKALVQEGWDPYIGEKKRPYVWMRGMTAGGQRYATMWSGDTDTDFEEMALQLRGMQSAGISGFAFWGHDAGGFIDHSGKRFADSPVDSVYARWSMQLGSFSPTWKPHGMGKSRWPEDRGAFSKQVAEKYIRLRYRLMPYLYHYAHIAASKGLPMVRPMLLEYPGQEPAWQFDTQFMFGESMLVAPVTRDTIDVWLPPGTWYDFRTDQKINGGTVLHSLSPPLDELPIWVKAGSVIPMYEYALSTYALDKGKIILHLYPGADGRFLIKEDDGITEKFRKGEIAETLVEYAEKEKTLVIHPTTGHYTGAPGRRQYTIILHDASRMNPDKMKIPAGSVIHADKEKNTLEVTCKPIGPGQEIRLLF